MARKCRDRTTCLTLFRAPLYQLSRRRRRAEGPYKHIGCCHRCRSRRRGRRPPGDFPASTVCWSQNGARCAPSHGSASFDNCGRVRLSNRKWSLQRWRRRRHMNSDDRLSSVRESFRVRLLSLMTNGLQRARRSSLPQTIPSRSIGGERRAGSGPPPST